jgi:Lrp/AsnC family transcriptional regulator, leucine-responsive regulatory protein
MSIKLTKADYVILKNLAYNSRMFDVELARKCNLSKDSIRYRIARLEKLGIINGYGAFIDYVRLGYKSFKLYLRLNATFDQRENLRDFLKKEKNVFAIFESNGEWDIGIAVFVKTRVEYYDFEEKLLSNIGSMINSKMFCLMLDAVVFNNLLIDDTKEEYHFWQDVPIDGIDEKDRVLLNALHEDSRQNLVNLAKKIGLSIDATSKRMKKLVSNKVISFYTADIDYNKLGFQKYKLFVSVKSYSKEIEMKLFEFFRQKRSVTNVIRIIGPWKLEVEFLIKEHNEFEIILSEMQEQFSDVIQKLDFSIFKNEIRFPSEKLLI